MEYIKIQLLPFKDTSKSAYVNGVVIKKSIAHNRMPKQIKSPKVLLLANSLGIQQDNDDFLDLGMQIRSEEAFIGNIINKIELVNPDIIFLEKDANM